MNLNRLLFAGAFAVAITAGTLVETSAAPDTEKQAFTADKSHADIGFSVKHLVISKVRGHFGDFEADLHLDADNKLVAATATIQASSIDTANEDRDDHLRNADFFNVEEFPEITFVSKTVKDKVIVADFTMHGVTKEIELPYELNGPVKDPWGNIKVALSATTTINRTDFGLTWNKALETGGVIIGEDVEITIEVEFAKK